MLSILEPETCGSARLRVCWEPSEAKLSSHGLMQCFAQRNRPLARVAIWNVWHMCGRAGPERLDGILEDRQVELKYTGNVRASKITHGSLLSQ